MKPELFPKRKQWRQFLAGWTAGFSLFLVVVGSIAWSLVVNTLPLPPSLFRPITESMEFADRSGQRLRSNISIAKQFGTVSSESELPAVLVDATIAAEDARFHRHHGIDPLATARALLQWWTQGRVVSGASTITQQLIKLASPVRERRDWLRKAHEALQACRLEQIWTKEQILAAYFNRLNYGNLNQGVTAAAWGYFRKSPENLSLAEAAFLAGIPQSPTRLNPRKNFPATKARQEWILSRMEQLRQITTEERLRAVAQPITLAPLQREFQAPHFVDWILQLPGTLSTGLRQTTLDLPLNLECEQILNRHLATLRAHHVQNGAIVVLDNKNSEVLAMVGSEAYFQPTFGQVNGANSPRSAGSTLKPFTYRLALERGAFPGTVLADVPVEYQTSTGLFRPQNYSRHCHGPISLREALANSLNIPAVRVLDSVGGPSVLQDELVHLGFSTLTNSPEHYGLGLTLGNAEVTLIELANAYASLARQGEWKPIQWNLQDPALQVTSRTNTSTDSASMLRRRQSCWLIADILADNHARTMEFGLDSPLRFDFPVACKTGTSTEYRDNWAVGFTPEFTVAVWVGNFDGSPMQNVSGIAGAAPVLHDVFEFLHATRGTSWASPPPGLQQFRIQPESGKQLPPSVTAPSVGRLEWARENEPPPVESQEDRDSLGRWRLGSEYDEWLAAQGRNTHPRFAPRATAGLLAFRITSPLDGSRYFVDADLPARAQKIVLKASKPCTWRSDSLRCLNEGLNPEAELSPGHHRLIARDRETGVEIERWIEVKRL
jgi:penicillin-binding protein 1C